MFVFDMAWFLRGLFKSQRKKTSLLNRSFFALKALTVNGKKHKGINGYLKSKGLKKNQKHKGLRGKASHSSMPYHKIYFMSRNCG